MKKTYGLVLITIVLCLVSIALGKNLWDEPADSNSNKLKLFNNVLTKGEIILTYGEGHARHFTVIYKRQIYNCVTAADKGSCELVEQKLY